MSAGEFIKLARQTLSVVLFVLALLQAFGDHFDRACFDLLLAVVVAPEIWLRLTEQRREPK